MLEKLIINHCSPTLAGLKTGSLFGIIFDNRYQLKDDIQNINNKLNEKGVYVRVLKIENERALVYVYRKKHLENDFLNEEIKGLLQKIGYKTNDTNKCLNMLATRLKKNFEFPHEIGLFLGYPLEDVKGFIKHKGCNCCYQGVWKVYSPESNALKVFAKYNKCTKVYYKKWNEGFSLTRLTICT